VSNRLPDHFIGAQQSACAVATSRAFAAFTLAVSSNLLGRSIGRSPNVSPFRMWQRFMDRMLVETNVKHRFTDHDRRAKVASDAATLEKARASLQYADARTTACAYQRKLDRV
jgi:hypothetical protein